MIINDKFSREWFFSGFKEEKEFVLLHLCYRGLELRSRLMGLVTGGLTGKPCFLSGLFP